MKKNLTWEGNIDNEDENANAGSLSANVENNNHIFFPSLNISTANSFVEDDDRNAEGFKIRMYLRIYGWRRWALY